ncbi:MAG TPA: AtpZ/AtpI family protein [Stellaceae bacterium]|nr:AtpZ/AtpI family protein [Stellaceae bacterium]
MGEGDPRASLKQLGDRLDKARGGMKQAAPQGGNGIGDTQNALGQGLRIGVELVVAVVVSVGIGWALDNWFGTKPALMVVFFFLGIGAGMWNVYRAVKGMGSAMGVRRETPESNAAWDDEDED